MHHPVVTDAATLRIPPGSRNVEVHISFESLIAITGVGVRFWEEIVFPH